MYSQDPEVRRRRVKLRFFAYGIMTIATIVFGAASLFYILGYRVDNSFEVERGGLLKFDSRPQNARVALDNKDIEATPDQINASAGTHTISYSKEGYQGWQKTVNLHPGEVLWLNYARLIPTSITTTVIKELSSIHQTAASPSREWYLVHTSPSSKEFTLVDLRNEEGVKSTQIALPADIIASGKGNHMFEVQEWSRDDRFVLVRHKIGKLVEYIRLSRENPSESKNLNELFDLNFTSAQFAANNPNVFFAKDKDSNFYRLDVNDEAPLKIAEKVSTYDNLNASEVAFIGRASSEEEKPQTKNRTLYIWRDNGKLAKALRSVPLESAAYVAYGPYLAHNYVSLVFGNSISVVQDPLSSAKTMTSATMPAPAASLQESPGNRYFLAQGKSQFYVYDIELARTYKFSSPDSNDEPAQWADDHHIVLNGGNSLRLEEFDGTNTQQITSVAGPYDVILGADGEILLSIGKSAASGKLELQQSLLRTEAKQRPRETYQIRARPNSR